MKLKITNIVLILSVSFIQLVAQQIEVGALVKNALTENHTIIASSLDLRSEELKYESVKSGNLPSLGFTTNSANPLYKYSNGEEFSTSTYTSSEYERHKIGGGLNVGVTLPTGGSLTVTGTGYLDLALPENEDEWEYLVNPALAIYFRQPLFIDRLNGSVIRFDSMKLANELAFLSLNQSQLTVASVENSLILAITSTAVGLNNLRYSYELLKDRLSLQQKKLDLAYQDEQAGRLSRLDSLAEELQMRRQQETLIEIEFQIDAAEKTLESLSGLSEISGKEIALNSNKVKPTKDVDPLKSFGVISSELVQRSVELSQTVVPNGDEPVVEVSSLLGKTNQDTSSIISTAFDEAFSSDMDFSVSLSLSFSAFDWGESKEKHESGKTSLMAAEKRLDAAKEEAQLQIDSAMRNLQLIEEKFKLLKQGYEYDNSILEREQQRFEAGLTSELALETIKLDKKEREYQIKQLNDQKFLALLELYTTGGWELKKLFE